MEGSVATRKVRAKRFVECFMESFRIVDFLSPVEQRSPGFMTADVRANVRARCPCYLCKAREAAENIKGYYLNSRKSFRAFCASDDGGEVLPESVIAISSGIFLAEQVDGAREKYSKSSLFRIINVKNILEAFINVGCKET